MTHKKSPAAEESPSSSCFSDLVALKWPIAWARFTAFWLLLFDHIPETGLESPKRNQLGSSILQKEIPLIAFTFGVFTKGK